MWPSLPRHRARRSCRSRTSGPASSTPTDRRGHGAARRGAGGGSRPRDRRLRGPAGGLLPALLGLEQAHDVARADQWIRVGEAIAKRRNLPAVSAFCSTHYGGVLTAAGRWPEADVALTDAVRLWSPRSPVDAAQRRARPAGRPARPAGTGSRTPSNCSMGSTLSRRPKRPSARRGPPRQGRGRPRSRRPRQRAPRPGRSRGYRDGCRCWRCWSTCISRSGARARRRRRGHRLNSPCAQTATSSHYLMAIAGAGPGSGQPRLGPQTGDPQACLREALAGFARAQTARPAAVRRSPSPVHSSPSVPRWRPPEARAALEVFERLRGRPTTPMRRRRSCGHSASGPRQGIEEQRADQAELEVLVLLSHGLSNPEIPPTGST